MHLASAKNKSERFKIDLSPSESDFGEHARAEPGGVGLERNKLCRVPFSEAVEKSSNSRGQEEFGWAMKSPSRLAATQRKRAGSLRQRKWR